MTLKLSLKLFFIAFIYIMGYLRTMGPGLAGSTTKVYGGGVNVNQVQYGNKLQGLPPVTGNRRPYKIYKSKAGGNEPGRSRVFCINQLGGIGMANKNSQFAPNADGVGDCHPWKPKPKRRLITVPDVDVGGGVITFPNPLPQVPSLSEFPVVNPSPNDGLPGGGEEDVHPDDDIHDPVIHTLELFEAAIRSNNQEMAQEMVIPLVNLHVSIHDIDIPLQKLSSTQYMMTHALDGDNPPVFTVNEDSVIIAIDINGDGEEDVHPDGGITDGGIHEGGGDVAFGDDFLTALHSNNQEMAQEMAKSLINLTPHETGLPLQEFGVGHYTMTHALEGHASPVFKVNEEGVITAIDVNGDGQNLITEHGIQHGEAATEAETDNVTEQAPESQPQTLTMAERVAQLEQQSHLVSEQRLLIDTLQAEIAELRAISMAPPSGQAPDTVNNEGITE